MAERLTNSMQIRWVISLILGGVFLLGAAIFAPHASPADIPPFDLSSRAQQYSGRYYWTTTPVEGGGQILTLVGRFEHPGQVPSQQNVPLLAVLRDGLAAGNQKTERLRYVWLLTYRRPGVNQRILSAVPFFYWSWNPGNGDKPGDWDKTGKVPAPIADLSEPTHHVVSNFGRDVLQWAAFDPMTTAIRASSREYRSNGSDYERLHVEEAVAFLREAPAANDENGLTQAELDSVIARLELTKTMLGGFVAGNRLKQIAATQGAQRSETIGRNWELLRTSAERAGLLFEPIRLTDSGEEYAVLWFPLNRVFSAPGISLASTWKLLHIPDPWTDSRLKNWKGYEQMRWLDSSGRLLPEGETGASQVALAPLAVYSLTYPRSPLLMVDFRHGLKPKRAEIAQRGSDEFVMGVLRLSHFANWYYFVGQAMYEFVKTRHGGAEDLSQRLDAYSEFRVAVTLNTSLDPGFRKELQQRVKALDVNPLGSSPDGEVALAQRNFDALQKAASDDGKLPARLDKDRREELAKFSEGSGGKVWNATLHYGSLGLYTRRTPRQDDNAEMLVRDREVESLVTYLEQVRDSGPRPEVSFPSEQIQKSMAELTDLLNEGTGSRVRKQAAIVISAVQSNTKDETVLAGCSQALSALNMPKVPAHSAASIAATPRIQVPAPAEASLTAK
ncbi:MAG: hypothetical protein WAM39_28365 [Bryobacteraceae bacterium]